jgi:hypothetical protein
MAAKLSAQRRQAEQLEEHARRLEQFTDRGGPDGKAGRSMFTAMSAKASPSSLYQGFVGLLRGRWRALSPGNKGRLVLAGVGALLGLGAFAALAIFGLNWYFAVRGSDGRSCSPAGIAPDQTILTRSGRPEYVA